MKTMQFKTLSIVFAVIFSGCGGGNSTNNAGSPLPNPGAPLPNPQPSDEIADAFLGSWLKGKTSPTTGNCEIYKLVISKTAANAVRSTNERVTFSNKLNSSCSGNLVDVQEHFVRDFVITDIGTEQTIGTYKYYPAQFYSLAERSPESRMLAFKTDRSFCILNATTAAQVQSQLDQIADPTLNSNCYTKSSHAFTTLKPVNQLTTASFKFDDDVGFASPVALTEQLNRNAQLGYILLGTSWSYENIKVNAYIRDENDSRKFQYSSLERTPDVLANEYNTWFQQLNLQGQSGYQFVHSIRPNTQLRYIDYFVRDPANTTSYSYDKTYFHPIPTQQQIEDQLNFLGSNGCRVIDFKSYFTGFSDDILGGNQNQPKIATCMNSSSHNGTYTYRYAKRPKLGSTLLGADTRALQQLINQQAQQGYRLIHTALDISNTEKDSLLFMRDSEDSSVIEYKVFNDTVLVAQPSTDTLNRRLNEHAQMGWLMSKNLSIYTTSPKALSTTLPGVMFP